ncbi:MAG TPA: hypothetical protein VF067_08005 [Sphingomicrobium sp.]
MTAIARERPWPWPELLFLIPIVAGNIYTACYFVQYGYLPQPYFYEPGGVFMDFFSVATYGQNGDAYQVFATIYPPLSFVLLKLTTWAPCYVDSGLEEARYCDYLGLGSLVGIFFLNAALIALAFWKIDKRTAIPRTVALAFGLPMTYTLERGNLLLFCFTSMLLAYGPLLRSARLRWVFAGMAVNFKPYLIGTVFAQLLRRRWRWFEGAILATVLVYLVTFAVYGEGSLGQMYENITLYAGGFKGSTILDLWYPSSMVPFRTLLEGDAAFDVAGELGSQVTDWLHAATVLVTWATVTSIFAAAAAAWWRPQAVPVYRLVFLSAAAGIVTGEVGGYTQILLLLFVFMEPWRGFGRILALLIAYVLCIPLDIQLGQILEVYRDSFLSGRWVASQYSLSVGILIRPLLVHVMIFTLSLVTIRDVLADMKSNGWRVPWRFLPYGPYGRHAPAAPAPERV